MPRITLIIENVDPKLLTYQRNQLIDLEAITTDQKQKNALNGIINLLEKATDEYLESIGE